MNTLLALTTSTGFSRAVQSALGGSAWRVISATSVQEADPFLRSAMVQVVLLESDITGLAPVRVIESLRRINNKIPILLFAEHRSPDWEEEAYLQGVSQIFSKPLRPLLLKKMLEQFEKKSSEISSPPPELPVVQTVPASIVPNSAPASKPELPPLQSADSPEQLVQDLLAYLRQSLGINRAAIFLRREQDLFCAASCAIEPERVAQLPLSLESGLGEMIYKSGRVLDATTCSIPELTILGVRWALPWQDGEGLLGMILLDDPLAGGMLNTSQLQSTFRFCESAGSALRQLRRRDAVSEQMQVLADALDRKGCGVYVISPSEKILHESTRARSLAGLSTKPQRVHNLSLELMEGFQAILQGEKEYTRVLCRGQSCVQLQAFKESSGNVFLLLEDITQQKKSESHAVEAANDALVQTMAEHLAHEIGNSLAPLSTHQQLLSARYDDPEFRDSLSQTMAESVRRITRFAQQVVSLSQKDAAGLERVPLDELIYASFNEARIVFGGITARLLFKETENRYELLGNRKAFTHALSELFLNALQSNGTDPQVQVRIVENSGKLLKIRIADTGAGFTEEALQRAFEPFYSTRNVGLGLGLTVARQIVRLYHGDLDITESSDRGAVLTFTCLQAVPAKKNVFVDALN